MYLDIKTIHEMKIHTVYFLNSCSNLDVNVNVDLYQYFILIMINLNIINGSSSENDSGGVYRISPNI